MGLKIPRDWTRTKEAIVSHILRFTATRGWLIMSLILSSGIFIGIFRIFGIDDTQVQTEFAKYGTEWIVLTMVLFFLPRIVLRGILRYRDVPRDWTKEQASTWEHFEARAKKSFIGKILDTLEIFFDGIRDVRMGFEHVKQETERTHNMKWKNFKLKTWIKHFLLLVCGYCAIVVVTLLLARMFVKDGNMAIPIFVGMLVSIFIFARIYTRKNRFKRKYVE